MRLRPDHLAAVYGGNRGGPLLEARLEVGPLGAAGPRELWRINESVLVDGEPTVVDQRLSRRDDGTYVLVGVAGTLVEVDAGAGSVRLVQGDGPLAYQLVTTIALPLLLHGAGVLVLHASAAAPTGGPAVLVCGNSGRGKSSVLAGLIEAGWQAVGEDMCAVDLGPEGPRVWPGPPWVRLAGPGPAGARPRFTVPAKTAWDIAPWRVDRPVPVDRLVLLEEPGGDNAVLETLDTPTALAGLARHAVWLAEPDDRAPGVFGACVRLLASVRASRLRLPVDRMWRDRAVAALDA